MELEVGKVGGREWSTAWCVGSVSNKKRRAKQRKPGRNEHSCLPKRQQSVLANFRKGPHRKKFHSRLHIAMLPGPTWNDSERFWHLTGSSVLLLQVNRRLSYGRSRLLATTGYQCRASLGRQTSRKRAHVAPCGGDWGCLRPKRDKLAAKTSSLYVAITYQGHPSCQRRRGMKCGMEMRWELCWAQTSRRQYRSHKAKSRIVGIGLDGNRHASHGPLSRWNRGWLRGSSQGAPVQAGQRRH